MEQVSYNLRLDLKDTGIVNTGFRLKQGDSGMKISVSIFNRGVNVFDSTTVPKIVFKRPDGASVMANMTVGSSVYEYVFVGNELQQPGVEIMDVKFTLPNDRRESSVSCSFVVVPDTITPNTHGSDIYDNDLAELVAEATAAAETVEEVVGDSEAWAVGERNGVPVGPEDPAYHNNSKYWSEQANVTSLAALTDVDLETLEDGDLLQLDGASGKWKNSSDVWATMAKNGAKNKARITATTQTVDGITYTIDPSAGTVIASGSLAAGKTSSYLAIGRVSVVAGDILTGCPVGSSPSDYELVVFNSSQTARIATDIGNGGVATSTDANAVFGIYIRKNLSSAIRFEPMVRIAEDKNETFVPHAMTNRELTEELDFGAVGASLVSTYINTSGGSSIGLRKWGHVCILQAQLKTTSSLVANTQQTIATLPSGYIPKYGTLSVATYDIGTSKTAESHDIELDTNGNVKLTIRNTHDINRWICAYMTYICV